jgi:hypothetical protein
MYALVPAPTLPIEHPHLRARAMLAVSRLVVRELERAGRLADDRPELSLATLERWLDGEEPIAAVHEALDTMAAAVSDDQEVVSATRCVLWTLRVQPVGVERAAEVARAVTERAVSVLVALGETQAAATHRVHETWRAAYAPASP